MKQTAGKKEHRPQMLSLRGSTPFLFLLIIASLFHLYKADLFHPLSLPAES